MLRFARKHPGLSVLGAAGVGLFGGLELATGVLLGAGVFALIERRKGEVSRDATKAARTVRNNAQEMLEHAPSKVKERVRAVVQAARGELHPIEKPAAPSGESRTDERGERDKREQDSETLGL